MLSVLYFQTTKRIGFTVYHASTACVKTIAHRSANRAPTDGNLLQLAHNHHEPIQDTNTQRCTRAAARTARKLFARSLAMTRAPWHQKC